MEFDLPPNNVYNNFIYIDGAIAHNGRDVYNNKYLEFHQLVMDRVDAKNIYEMHCEEKLRLLEILDDLKAIEEGLPNIL